MCWSQSVSTWGLVGWGLLDLGLWVFSCVCEVPVRGEGLLRVLYWLWRYGAPWRELKAGEEARTSSSLMTLALGWSSGSSARRWSRESLSRSNLWEASLRRDCACMAWTRCSLSIYSHLHKWTINSPSSLTVHPYQHCTAVNKCFDRKQLWFKFICKNHKLVFASSAKRQEWERTTRVRISVHCSTDLRVNFKSQIHWYMVEDMLGHIIPDHQHR